nr:fumarylacetoacetate hydrolase family protein [Propylenella binzhouense]
MVRFEAEAGIRLGALWKDGGLIVDLRKAVAALLEAAGDPFADEEAAIRIPGDTAEFLRRGDRSEALVREALAALEAGGLDPSGVTLSCDAVRLAVPIVPPLIVCGGANFWDHLRELGRDKPDHVEFFLKNAESVVGPQDPIPYRPWASGKLDYEVELGIVIGRRARCVAAADALDFVFGYTVVNDMAIRDRQLFAYDPTTFHVKYGDGKVFDANSALGPAIVSRDEVPDPMNLPMSCSVDGAIRQDSNTRSYIWGVREVVEYYSSMITLEPGFVICPGTPGGCAVGSDPECGGRHAPRDPHGEYLRPGQSVMVAVGGIGTLRNEIGPGPAEGGATGQAATETLS